ncbi:hypothetical protein PSN45_004816 [Yamadazyma tenuis]|uniref:Uncharacterized protein n=1 Tax=Candida tenuis (strain ATCC 10573 / BCRC 21748 / CBS 615 / JCM 9827 / NBRC 10315 / NRRL Y-1498 / VKM Y-70) TaxID=590646 RepID=G3B1Q4_CANTC|nr:uncharacterized protein CANTEDRAFT_113271 [Yamadazyma tenuis ATCC 10573]EGV64504.1 hypothetical protein CANTEDRAFT_113271 [Yamadazyma tenuis ATCC 10573]WEJ97267.1 hypothetical protein PSN45_004816 [Yamadazyma tenuis]
MIARQIPLILKSPINSPVSMAYLWSLSDDKKRLACLYKRFYRLRNLIDHDRRNVSRYKELIRWKFAKENYNTRRSVILGKPEEPISEIFTRIFNTLTFVHNSTVILPENMIDKKAYFYKDTRQNHRIEKQIILTICRMQYVTPNELKYRSDFSWFPEVRKEIEDFPENATKRQMAKSTSNPSYIGFADYQKNLMLLNEMYKLCL